MNVQDIKNIGNYLNLKVYKEIDGVIPDYLVVEDVNSFFDAIPEGSFINSVIRIGNSRFEFFKDFFNINFVYLSAEIYRLPEKNEIYFRFYDSSFNISGFYNPYFEGNELDYSVNGNPPIYIKEHGDYLLNNLKPDGGVYYVKSGDASKLTNAPFGGNGFNISTRRLNIRSKELYQEALLFSMHSPEKKFRFRHNATDWTDWFSFSISS